MKKITINLPTSILRIIEDTARRKGEKTAASIRSKLIQHMLATDEAFICSACGGYNSSGDMCDKQDVCAACRSLG